MSNIRKHPKFHFGWLITFVVVGFIVVKFSASIVPAVEQFATNLVK